MKKGVLQSPHIQGVELFWPLQLEDERGRIRRMCRKHDPHVGLVGMEEIYFSTVYPGVVKAWHHHKEMTLRYACVYGSVHVGLYDDREGSSTRGQSITYFLDDWGQNYFVLCIPPFVWNGFRCDPKWPDMAVIANCASQVHSPDEIVRMKIEDAPFDFDWGEYEISG